MKREISSKEKAQNRQSYLKRQEAITRTARAYWRSLPKAEQQRRSKLSTERCRNRPSIEKEKSAAALAEKEWRFRQWLAQRTIHSTDIREAALSVITLEQLRCPTYTFKLPDHRKTKERIVSKMPPKKTKHEKPAPEIARGKEIAAHLHNLHRIAAKGDRLASFGRCLASIAQLCAEEISRRTLIPEHELLDAAAAEIAETAMLQRSNGRKQITDPLEERTPINPPAE